MSERASKIEPCPTCEQRIRIESLGNGWAIIGKAAEDEAEELRADVAALRAETVEQCALRVEALADEARAMMAEGVPEEATALDGAVRWLAEAAAAIRGGAGP